MATKTYYFNAHGGTSTNYADPANADNDSTADYASQDTGSTAKHEYTGNNAAATNYGAISSVVVYPYCYLYNAVATTHRITVTPKYDGSVGTLTSLFDDVSNYGPGQLTHDVTTGTNAPATWTWGNVTTLDLEEITYRGRTDSTMRLYRCRIIVTYTPVASTLAWSSPAAASTHYRAGTGIAIAGTAANTNGIAKVQYNVDGGSWVDCTGTTNWSATVPQASLPTGAITINTRVQENSGDDIWTTTTARAFVQSNIPSGVI